MITSALRKREAVPSAPRFRPALRKAIAAIGLVLLAALMVAGPAYAERRVALVVGNAAYQHAPPLRNPVHDADAVSGALRTLDFDVTVATDVDKIGMEQALRRFAVQLEGADIALFYYSGHAVQIEDRNYLVPVSAAIEGARNPVLDGVALQDISAIMQRAGARVQLLFLDACRDNPFGTALAAAVGESSARGLARVQTPSGSLVAFSTAPGASALDGTGALSPFTAAFARYVVVPKLEIRQVLSRMRADVSNATDQRQVPWDSSSLLNDFYFVPNRAPPAVEPVVRVAVEDGPAPQPLHLTPPSQPEGGRLSVSVIQEPAAGHLRLDGKQVATGDQLTPGQYAQLAYEGTSSSAVDTFSLKVDDAWGNSANSVVVVAREKDAVPQKPPAPQPLGDFQLTAVSLLGLGPNLIFKDQPRLADADKQRRVKLASNLPFGQLLLDQRVIEQGRSVEVADLSRLAFIPPTGFEGRHLDATFVPDGSASGQVKLGIDVAMTDCDRLAGDRLDQQGVSEGVLPGRIDVKAALPACESAVRAQPTNGRFNYQLGRVYASLGRETDARDLFRKAADLGHVRATWALGYRAAYVQPTDLPLGKSLWERAAAQGDVYAVHSLGQMYYEGRGVPKDLVKARGLFEQAASMGHTFSMNSLGRMYQHGETVPVDLAMTRRYWSESAARGDIYGIDNMGFVYLEGLGVPKNTPTALTYFEQAASLGHPEAPNNIGRIYVLGLGVPVDFTEARKWDRMGAERGDAWASYNMGELERLGHGGPIDGVQAGYFYARAAASTNRLEPAELGRKALAALDRPTKVAVLGRLVADIDPQAKGEAAWLVSANKAVADRKLSPTDKSLDALLIATAQVVAIEKNPRVDLF